MESPLRHKFFTRLVLYFLFGVVCLIALFPNYWIFVTAFKHTSEIYTYPPEWIPTNPTLDNFQYVLFSSPVPQSLLNSIFMGITSTAIALMLAAGAAYGFSRYRFRAKTGLMLFILGIQMVPGVITVIPLYFIITWLGLLDTLTGIILVYAVVNIPFAIWLLKGFFDTVPIEIDESAQLDGAGPWQTFVWILLPVISPGLAAAAVVIFVNVWNLFFTALLLSNSVASRVAAVGVYLLKSEMVLSWEILAAGAVVATVPVIILFFALQRYFIAGMTSGAIR